MSDIDRIIEIDKSLRPNYWAHSENIARIIAPEAFIDDYVIEPPEARATVEARLQLLQYAAIRKAHDIMVYFGIDCDADWTAIFTQLAAEKDTTHER